MKTVLAAANVTFRPPLPLPPGEYSNHVFFSFNNFETTFYFLRSTIPYATEMWQNGSEIELPIVAVITLPRMIADDLLKRLAESSGFEVRMLPEPNAPAAPAKTGGGN